MLATLALLSLVGGVAMAQAHPSCDYEYSTSPSYRYGHFAYPPTPTASTTPVPNAPSSKPLSTYALAYSDVQHHFSNLSTTFWGNWSPSLTPPTPEQTPPSEPFGNAAWSSLWDIANPTNFTRGFHSTTLSPTPIPPSELFPPPALYFTPKTCHHFPRDFIFGVAGSAVQCEGAVADEGKSPSFPDLLGNVASLVGLGAASALTGSQRDGEFIPDYVTLEHYYLYKQDIERLAAIGVKWYYFSIAWTRILPFAVPGTPVNERGLRHYGDVIDFVLEKGMRPVVALTHFDTPLQFFGGGEGYLETFALAQASATYGIGGQTFGYANESFVEAFVNYARIVMSHYADRVPIWITFNEPQVGSHNGKEVDHVLKAHARVYHWYKNVLKGTGKLSFKNGISPAVPLDSENRSHIAAADYFNDLYIGSFMRPLALGEDYPRAYKKTVPDYIPLSADDLQYLKGTVDFTALDSYTAPIVVPADPDILACAAESNISLNHLRRFPTCINITTLTETGWSTGLSSDGSPLSQQNPHNLRTVLNYAWNAYKLPVFLTEFGLSSPVPPGGRLQDNLFNVPQSEYLLSHLNEILKAIWEDGVDVMGALVWSWADDWEIGTLKEGFGLQFVDLTTQERRYRRSFFDVMGFVEGRRET